MPETIFINLVLVALAFLLGYFWQRLVSALKTPETPVTPHHGLYGHPTLSRYWALREKETLPWLRTMPLREYVKYKEKQ